MSTLDPPDAPRRPVRWHIAVFLAPAVIVYTLVMILPLAETLRLAFDRVVDNQAVFVGLENSARSSSTRAGPRASGMRSRTMSSSS